MSSSATIFYRHPSPGVLTRWVVNVGDNVEEGQLVAEFEGKNDQAYIPITASHEGKVDELLAKKGSVYVGGEPIVRVTACLHDIQFAGLCATCGKDLTVATGQAPSKYSFVPAGVHTQKHLTLSQKEAERLAKDTAGSLRKQRKLSLVLDLDHTLIHAATEAHFHQFSLFHNVDPKAEQLYEFNLPNSPMKYFVKLRPHLTEFLQVVSSLYELHMYTFGTRAYAKKVARIIDPTERFFKERILSRDDCGDLDYKSLKRIFPCDDSMVVVVDDREDVWRKSRNLIRIEPFLYFVGLPEVNPLPYDPRHPSPSVPPQQPPSHHTHPSQRRPPPIPPSHPHPPLRRSSARRDRPHPPPSHPQPSHPPPSHPPPSHAAPPHPHTTVTHTNGNTDHPENNDDKINENNKNDENTQNKTTETSSDDESTGNSNNNNNNHEINGKQEGNDTKTNSTNEDENNLERKAEEEKKAKEDQKEKPKDNAEKGESKETKDEDKEKKKEEGESAEQSTSELEPKSKAESELKSETEPKSETESKSETEPKSEEDTATEEPKHENPPVPAAPQWPPPPDECLPFMMQVLQEVHRRFYALQDTARECDTKDIITNMRRSVLAGCNVVFSGFYPREVDVRTTPLGKLAENFGAVCQPDIAKTTTHLIAKKNHTDKVKVAQSSGRIYVVTDNWLVLSARRWRRAKEQEHLLTPNSAPVSIPTQENETDTDPQHKSEVTIDKLPKANEGQEFAPIPINKLPKIPKKTNGTSNDIPYPKVPIIPQKSLLEEMRQEAAELFGEVDGKWDEDENGDGDEGMYPDDDDDRNGENDEDRESDEERDENDDDDMAERGDEEEEEEGGEEGEGLRGNGRSRLSGMIKKKRKREPQFDEDEEKDFAAFLEDELGK